MIILKNGQLTIKIKPYGAELAGISDNRTGREYLWQGEPSIWSGQSPILFPIVGRLCSDSFLYQDKKYYLPKHGFARKSQFEILMASDERASFRLEASEETRRVYPFDFALTVEYALKDKTLAVSSAVKNLGNDEMYFSLGAHPAFNIEIGDFVKFSDYESFTTLLFNESGLMSGEKALAKRRKNIEITEHIFDEDALFFPNLASTSAKIVSKSGRELLKMDFGKVPFVGLWAKPARRSSASSRGMEFAILPTSPVKSRKSRISTGLPQMKSSDLNIPLRFYKTKNSRFAAAFSFEIKLSWRLFYESNDYRRSENRRHHRL